MAKRKVNQPQFFSIFADGKIIPFQSIDYIDSGDYNDEHYIHIRYDHGNNRGVKIYYDSSEARDKELEKLAAQLRAYRL